MLLPEYLVDSIVNNWTGTLFLVTVSVLVYLVGNSTKNPKNFPPGPRGFPILGVAPLVGRRPEITFANWSKKYGDVVGFKMGNKQTIVLNSYEAIQEINAKHITVFSHRPDNFIFRDVLKKKGVAFSDYTPEFVIERKFDKATLNRLGFGTTSMEMRVIDEAKELIQQFGDSNTELDKVAKTKLLHATANVIAQMSIGKRFADYHDPEFTKIMSGWLDFFRDGSPAYLATMVLPWLRYIPPVRGSANSAMSGIESVCDALRQEITEHEKSLNENITRDFMDEYLIEVKKKTDQQSGPFTRCNLEHSVRDFFGASLEPASNTILYSLLILANRPEMMKRVHDEIDAVIGSNGIPYYALKGKMEFCHAFILEVMRFRTLAPLSVPHCTSENVKFRGYYIPKGTTVLPNLYAVNNDPTYWNKPEQFNPDRHLNNEGRVSVSKYFIPFGYGHRRCIGRRLAELIIFIFFIAICQRYDVVPTPNNNCKRPHVYEDSKLTGLTLSPPEETPVTLVRRNAE